jgi:hypothetical protein
VRVIELVLAQDIGTRTQLDVSRMFRDGRIRRRSNYVYPRAGDGTREGRQRCSNCSVLDVMCTWKDKVRAPVIRTLLHTFG